MDLRALIVLLLTMNLGVALWWALRPAPDPAPAPALPADVPRLQLVSEVGPEALEAAALNAANANVQAGGPLVGAGEGAAQEAAGLRCFSLGPWEDAGAAGAAMDILRPQALRLRERPAPVGVGWRVIMPPLASRDAAEAALARLVEAGFTDHLIIGSGAEANAIALGRFSAEAGARRHAAALREAGFNAVAEPLGPEGGVWIDLAAGPDFDPDAAREATAAAGLLGADCARLQ